jgi:protein-L-isoaspartate(D-aspartate) O-methyltransferase
MAFRALDLADGDALVDLGAGSGYGAAVASNVVGARGSVIAIEYDAELARRATALLADRAHVRVVHGDAHDTTLWRGAKKVNVGFDVETIPEAWIEALAAGARLVAPESGKLVVVDKGAGGEISRRAIADVVYVRDRSERGEIDPGKPARVRVLEIGATRAGA